MKPPATVRRLPRVASLSWDDCRLLVETVRDYAIFMMDVDGLVATWNLGAERIKGYKADEIIGEHFSKFYPPEDISARKPEIELQTAKDFGRVEDEGWRVRKDGTRFWANVVITALYDETGALRGFGKVTRDLTDRRRAEDQLRHSEERFRLLVEGVGDYAIYMLDPAGHVSTWNLGAQRMKGYATDEVLGQHFSRFFPEEDVRSGKPERELAIARNEGRFEEEGWRVRKDGSRFWAHVVLTALHDAHGDLFGFAKVTRDLTDRKAREDAERRLLREQTARAVAEESEKALRDSEERHRALSARLEIILEGVADGITVQDRTGRITYSNRIAARLAGFASPEAFLAAPSEAMRARFVMHDEEGAVVAPEDLPGPRVLRGEQPGPMHLRITDRVDGREWWSLLRASPVLGEDGAPQLAVTIWHDVTDRRRNEREARYLAEATAALSGSLDYEEMLATLARVVVPGLADWCSIHLLEGERLRNVTIAHSDSEKLAAAREEAERFPPSPSDTHGAWNVIRTGKSELYNDLDDATFERTGTSEARRARLRAASVKAILIVPIRAQRRVIGTLALVSAESGRRYDDRDVRLAEEVGRRAGSAIENARLYSAERAAREALEKAARRAEEATRLKDEFLATVSHELRTPLNAILGWASIIRARNPEPGIAKGIDVIYRNAQAQARIVEDILDVSRIITGKLRLQLKPTSLVTVVQDAIEVVRPSAAAKSIAIAFTPPDELPLLVADPERLRQVVWNLLSNAVKFTDARGTITIGARQEGSKIAVTVRDTGRGVEREFLPYVFERFKQFDGSTTRRYGGLGLGLAIVRHIVELHGGQVRAESEGPGKGASFTFVIPIRAVATDEPTDEATRRRHVSSSPPPQRSLRGVRVLVVDDERDARELIEAVIAGAGGTTELADSAAAGLEALVRFRPDVLVSDVGMPDEDGLSFVRRVRALSAAEGGRLPAIALTAYARAEDRASALDAGFTTHVGKPVDPGELVAAIANLAALR